MLKMAFCGNDCNSCPRYIATQSGDEEQLREVANLWERLGYRDKVVPPEEIVCQGCLSATWCRYDVRDCAMEKGVDNCGRCKKYPCEKVLKMFKTSEQFEKNIKEKCSVDDYDKLLPFSKKKENLDREN